MYESRMSKGVIERKVYEEKKVSRIGGDYKKLKDRGKKCIRKMEKEGHRERK